MAHIDAGKTTTSERILFYSGKIHRMGDVDDGTTVMDWMPQEQERGITITSAATTFEWKGHRVNLIDTPGHVDFTVEVERSLRVLDGAIMVLCAVGGVEPQSSTVWRQADRYHVPRIAYVNKLDRTGADFFRVVGQLRDKLGANAHPVQIPVGSESSLTGVIDLIEGKYLRYEGRKPEDGYEEASIPEDLAETVRQYRDELVQACADLDEEIMGKYIGNEPISPRSIRKVLRHATLENRLTPVFCGSSLKNVGVEPLLDGVVDYLPCPKDIPPVSGVHPKTGAQEKRDHSDTAPFCAIAFKIATDAFVEKLTYFRVYSGTLKKGTTVLNCSTGKKERISRIIRMHANDREDIDEVYTGDIAAAVGVREVRTGNTLAAEKAPILLESIRFPEPVIAIAIEPKTQADKDRLMEVLQKMSDEDPSFRVSTNEESGQTIIAGMGELHLDIIRDRMMREFNLRASFGEPRVAYRETVAEGARGECKFVKQSGGKGQYAHVILRVQPLSRGSGLVITNHVVGGAIPKEFIKPVETGIRETATTGVLAGYRVDDVEVMIEDGSYHEVDSSELAFSIAASMAFKDAVRKARPVLLEPIMSVEIVTPESFTGDLVGDVNSRRGRVKEIAAAASSKLIRANIPLNELFGYATTIRSLTQGQATFTMEPLTFEPAPEALYSKIIG